MGAPSTLHFLLDQTFFGFNPSDRIQLHEAIFRLIWFGEGRWDWDTIYNLPIFIRKFYANHVNSILESKADAAEKQAELTSKKSSRKSR